MADKYCPNCKRMVGTKKNFTPGIIMIVVSLLVGLIPIIGWIIAPILFIIGLVTIIMGGKKCPICGTKSLQKEMPPEADPRPASTASTEEDAPKEQENK